MCCDIPTANEWVYVKDRPGRPAQPLNSCWLLQCFLLSEASLLYWIIKKFSQNQSLNSCTGNSTSCSFNLLFTLLKWRYQASLNQIPSIQQEGPRFGILYLMKDSGGNESTQTIMVGCIIRTNHAKFYIDSDNCKLSIIHHTPMSIAISKQNETIIPW